MKPIQQGPSTLSILILVIIAFVDGFLFAQALGGGRIDFGKETEALEPELTKQEVIRPEELDIREPLEASKSIETSPTLGDVDLEESSEFTDEQTTEPTLEPQPEAPSYEVPFISQAPLWDWKAPWDEFAEEAVIAMARHWINQTTPDSARAAGNELLAIDAADEQLSLAQIQSYFNASTQLQEVSSVQAILQALDGDALVIANVNGQVLDNPYYGDPAPAHHTILILSFDAENETFLAHDPGTNRGAFTAYDAQKILESIQDLDDSKQILILRRN